MYEENWGNEIKLVLTLYDLPNHMDTIKAMPRTQWESLVKKTILLHAFIELNNQYSNLDNVSSSHYTKLQQQRYFQFLSPENARTCFQVRTGVYNVKDNRPYLYRDNVCRLCESEEESVDHIINSCTMVPRDNTRINSIHSM